MDKELPKSSKVVVIGGGVAGTSCAYHLAKFGWKDVVLLERDQLTSGTTWHAAGLMGQLGASSTITKLRKYTLDLYQDLEKKTGCTRKCLRKIVKKGMGAYYSSGSRPNQSGSSWGIARLASSITGGKAAAVDYKILEDGCKKGSRALNLARKSRKKHGYGKRKVPKTK